MSEVVAENEFVLPGLMRRKEFARRANRCEKTLKRWEDAGKIVVVHLGNERLIDVPKTLARLRGEDRRRGRK
jgi:hypothetical protein